MASAQSLFSVLAFRLKPLMSDVNFRQLWAKGRVTDMCSVHYTHPRNREMLPCNPGYL